MVASLKELKKRISSSPSGPSFLSATPNTMAKSTRPRMFMPSVSVPTGTCSGGDSHNQVHRKNISGFLQVRPIDSTDLPIPTCFVPLQRSVSPGCKLSACGRNTVVPTNQSPMRNYWRLWGVVMDRWSIQSPAKYIFLWQPFSKLFQRTTSQMVLCNTPSGMSG